MPLKDPQYAPISQYDIDEGKVYYSDSPTCANESISQNIFQLRGKPKAGTNTFHRWEWVTRGVLFLLSFAFFSLWITSTGVPKCTHVVKYCEYFICSYVRGRVILFHDTAAPANEAIEYIEHFKYKGSLHFTTLWRGDEIGNPSPDIDAAWRRITTDGEYTFSCIRH